MYRRALAPIMIYVGVMGLIAASVGEWYKLWQLDKFAMYWLTVGLVTMVGAFTLARRQAIGDEEPFWSPPTRRVCQSAAPLLCVGVFLGLAEIFWSSALNNPLYNSDPTHPITRLIALWLMCFGGAMHAVGFFMKRGIKLFGWLLILAGMSLYIALNIPILVDKMPAWPGGAPTPDRVGNLLMGALFGGSHLAYGIYLYYTEEKPEAEETPEEDPDEK